jgi:adenosine/AMP kinase
MASAGRKLELEVVDIENPKEYNFILGHGTHRTMQELQNCQLAGPSLPLTLPFLNRGV